MSDIVSVPERSAHRIGERSAHRLLQTDFINRPIDLRPALERAAVEHYWLERMAAAEAEEQK